MCGIAGSTHVLIPESVFEDTMNRGIRRHSVLNQNRLFIQSNPPGVPPGTRDKQRFLLKYRKRNTLYHFQAPTGVDWPGEHHPFINNGVAIATNGVIHNHSQLVPDAWPYNNDTSCLAYLLGDRSLGGDIAWHHLSLLHGTFACWVFDYVTKATYIFRWVNPIYVHKRENGSGNWFASEEGPETELISEGVIYEWPSMYQVTRFKPMWHPYHTSDGVDSFQGTQNSGKQ